MSLHVGVLHYSPQAEAFPLLADPVHYIPDTQDMHKDREEMEYWLGVLHDQIGTVVAKAIASERGTPGELPPSILCACKHACIHTELPASNGMVYTLSWIARSMNCHFGAACSHLQVS